MTRQIAVSITLQYVCSTVHSHWVKSNTHTKQETGFQFLYTYSQVFIMRNLFIIVSAVRVLNLIAGIELLCYLEPLFNQNHHICLNFIKEQRSQFGYIEPKIEQALT